MATAHIQRTTTLEATERFGVMTRMVLQTRVVDLVDTSYAVLFTALGNAGIPDVGTGITGAGGENLILTERNPKLIDQSTVDVDLVYEHWVNEGQDLSAPFSGAVVGHLRADIQQQTSNIDAEGNTISLSHTYPSDDPDWPGETKSQGGEIHFFQPQRTFTIRGLRKVSRPASIANAIIGRVNGASWSGEPARTWLCVNVNWSIYDRGSPARYWFTFEFQHNPDTWDPTVVFTDERTGKPPVGLVEGTGYKTIKKLSSANFSRLVGSKIQGA